MLECLCTGRRAELLRRQRQAVSIQSTVTKRRGSHAEYSWNRGKNPVRLSVLDQSVRRVGCYMGRVCLCLSRSSGTNGFVMQLVSHLSRCSL